MNWIVKYKDWPSQAKWAVFIFSWKISASLTVWNCSRLNESRLGKMTTIFFLLLSFESSFDSNFIRSHACNNSSLQASPHHSSKSHCIRGNSCWCLGFNCDVINRHFYNQTTIWRMVIQLLRMAIIHLFVSIGYLVCFILLHCYKISVWSGEIIIVCVDQIV